MRKHLLRLSAALILGLGVSAFEAQSATLIDQTLNWTADGSAKAFDAEKQIRKGGIEITVTDFDPPRQASGDKHHLFEGRSSDIDDDDDEKAYWWAWRNGKNYIGGGNGTMKLLANAVGNTSHDKVEARVLGSQKYDQSAEYKLKTTWADDGTVEFHFNGKRIWSAKDHSRYKSKYKGFTSRKFYIGKGKYHGYPGVKGFKLLRVVVWEGDRSEPTTSISEDPADKRPGVEGIPVLFRDAMGRLRLEGNASRFESFVSYHGGRAANWRTSVEVRTTSSWRR